MTGDYSQLAAGIILILIGLAALDLAVFTRGKLVWAAVTTVAMACGGHLMFSFLGGPC